MTTTRHPTRCCLLLFSLVLLCQAATTASFLCPAKGRHLLPSPQRRPPFSSIPLFALSLRPAQAADVPAIIELAEETFGADIEDFGFIGQAFNTFFRWQVLIGFEARIAAWESSGGTDHAVLVLSDDDDDDDKGALAGLIELSMQPMTGDTAPMLPVPMNVKRMKPISPYISNLAIDPRFRRKGHAQRLVRACEKQAVDWGYENGAS